MEDIRKQVSEYYSNITTEKEGQMKQKSVVVKIICLII